MTPHLRLVSTLVALTAGGGDGLLRATERGRPEILAAAARASRLRELIRA